MTDTTRSYAFGLLTVLFWSTVATAFKLTLEFLDIYQLVFYATLTSVTTLAVALTIRSGPSRCWQAISQYRSSLFAGALNPVAYYLVLFAAYDRLPAQVAQPINYTWAIVLTFMSIYFLKQRITRWDIAAAFICYGGVVVIAGQGEWNLTSIPDLPGVLLALLSTVIWAGYWIINLKDQRDPLEALFCNFTVALPIALAVCLIFSDPLEVSFKGVAGAIYIGLFEMSLAFLAWLTALRLAPNTSRVSNLIFLSPFLSLIFIYTILGEPIYVTTYIGLVVIVTGLILQRVKAN